MAYALLSLVQILEQDQHKHHLSPASRSEIDLFIEKARSLRDLVDNISFDLSEDLRIRIRDAAHDAEDAIEGHIVELLSPILRIHDDDDDDDDDDLEHVEAIELEIIEESENTTGHDLEMQNLGQLVPNEEEEYELELELSDVMEEFDSIKEQIIILLNSENVQCDFEQSPTVAISSRPYPNSVWGFDRDINRLKNQLLSENKSQLQVIPIVGIAGSGKTQLADYLYYDSSVSSHLDIRAWATISQEFNLRRSLLALLDCLIHVTDEMGWENDKQLGEYLRMTLSNKRYLVVVDDIWNTNSWDELRKFFPDNNNGSRVILTTREWNLAEYAKTSFYSHQMCPIDNGSSWNLLCEKVFGGVHYCPLDLVETGMKIARNCKGHPLTIITIAGVLPASGNMLLVAWQRVESQQLNSKEVDSIKEDKMSKIHIGPSLKGFVDFFAKNGIRLMSRVMQGQSKLHIIPIVGVAESTGKTILARLIYDRALRGQHFDVHAWVSMKQVGTSLSKQRNVVTTLQYLLDSLYECGMPQLYDDDLGVRVHKTLINRRYLIVVDDARDVQTWEAISQFFPDEGNGSRIILTAREWSDYNVINPFRLDSYWEFLLGRVATLLPTPEMKLGFWKLVEEDYASSVTLNSGDLNLDLVSMSYNTLPYHLKPCFLYVGAFPEDYEIQTPQIIKMWIAEGFVSPVAENSLEDTAIMYLESLISRNLLFACERDYDGTVRRFKIHDVLWKFCKKRALDEKFSWFKDLNCENIEVDGVIVRRVSVNPKCVPSNDEDTDMSFARSFLCIGPASLDLAPMFLVLRLLRVLDVMYVDFNQFPQQLLQLINLRYMALTCNSDLPSSISIFRNLQTLIAFDVRSLPSEMWDLTQLRHIECPENCMWNISGEGESVHHEELQALYNIPAYEVTYKFLHHNPNLREMTIIFDDSHPLSIPLDCLNNLKLLECSYVGPQSRHDFLPYIRLPLSLRGLVLSSCIIHSEFLTTHVGSLPLLEYLKLEKCDLVDLKWEPAEGGYTRLRFLLMEDLNLVHWGANSTHFPVLEQLRIFGCRAMEEIPVDIGEIPTLKLIKVDEKCSLSVLTSAKRIMSEQKNSGNDLLRVIFLGGKESREPSGPTESSSCTPDCEMPIQKLEKSLSGEDSTVIMEAKGRIASSGGNYSDAIKHYSDAIDLSPSDDHLLYLNRSEAHNSLGQFSEALLDAQNIVQLKPDLSIGYFQLGNAYSNLNNYKDAISAYEKAIEIDPDNEIFKSHISHAKGKATFSSGSFVEAIQHWTDAINLHPLNHIYYYSRSVAHASLNQFSKSLSDAQKTVQLNPYWSTGYILLGDAYSNLENYKDAVSAYEKTLEIDPDNDIFKSNISYAKGIVALSSRSFVEAIQHLTGAINLHPSHHIYYYNRSLAHAHLNQFSKSLSDAQKSVQLNPYWSTGYSQLGNAYFNLKKYMDAISAYKKGFEIDPTNNDLKCDLLNARGLEACKSGNFIDAIQYYTDAIKLDPSEYIYYSNRSEAHASLNHFSKAMFDAQEVVRLDWSEGYSSLGDVYLGLKIYKDAVSAYEKGLKIDPTDDDLKSSLAIAKAACSIRKRKDI